MKGKLNEKKNRLKFQHTKANSKSVTHTLYENEVKWPTDMVFNSGTLMPFGKVCFAGITSGDRFNFGMSCFLLLLIDTVSLCDVYIFVTYEVCMSSIENLPL